METPSAAAKRFHLTTFGCQMNEHDSERMKGMLSALGYAEAESRENADLIIFNTCSIRENADNRFIAHLGEAKRLKGGQPGVVVGVGGCWAQSVKDEVFERFPFVDVAFGPGQIHKLAEFLTSDSLSAQGYFEFEDFAGHLPARRERSFQAWLQISQGCNCACSYCIVPSTRGREASRPAEELLAEVHGLAADGVREVTLLGQNVNSYGRDLRGEQRTTFAELLREVDAIDGIERVRYTSPHPKDMKEDVIRAHAECDSICEHIHLPLQSGSSPILKAMRRTYNRERYLDRVALIREHLPDVALTTDIIVGFPGETDADFEATLEVAETVGYDGAFTFVFSPRRGTEAAGLDGRVPHPVKKERMARLVEVVQRRARERAERFVGRTMDVLVEGPSRTDPSRLRGRNRHNKAVNFEGTARPGEIVDVEISSATSQTLLGSEVLLSRVD
ncbi:MAG TPA: tRNA (N6-isopentenyl adenosine(37)-C2)-methylthiotransferase MiaB [Solirubrobacterales bacterium]|jgi:tRNA-2-methylthio-N6-dimethylallyladenosine synthase|nr:tRNA (N6-isopentenyl adenosine(37)-C2)-methylthiotransferase MiaB [Solirubrobacterales bacterium]